MKNCLSENNWTFPVRFCVIISLFFGVAYGESPRGPADRIRYTYQGHCTGRDYIVSWTMRTNDLPDGSWRRSGQRNEVDSIDVQVDSVKIDEGKNKLLLHFLNTVDALKSKNIPAKSNKTSIVGANFKCSHSDRGASVFFYYALSSGSKVFGAALVSLDMLANKQLPVTGIASGLVKFDEEGRPGPPPPPPTALVDTFGLWVDYE